MLCQSKMSQQLLNSLEKVRHVTCFNSQSAHSNVTCRWEAQHRAAGSTGTKWNDPCFPENTPSQSEYWAKGRRRSLVFCHTTWITKCWKVIMGFLPNDTKDKLPTPALKLLCEYVLPCRAVSMAVDSEHSERMNILLRNFSVLAVASSAKQTSYVKTRELCEIGVCCLMHVHLGSSVWGRREQRAASLIQQFGS